MNEKELLAEINGENKNSALKEFLSYVVWLLGVWVTVQLIIHFVGTFSVVDGDSMQPTLHDKEYLWVDKLSYHFSEPERFDIVIFPIMYRGKESHFVGHQGTVGFRIDRKLLQGKLRAEIPGRCVI